MFKTKKTDAPECQDAVKGPWSGKKKLWVFAGVPLGLLGISAASAAIFFALAGVQGSGTNGEFTASFTDMYTSMDTSTMTVQPTGTIAVTGGKLVMPAMTVYPGETWSVTSSVKSGSASQTGYVSGVALTGLPSGYTVAIADGCGAPVSNSSASVKLQITAPANQTAGASWTLAGDAGVKVTPGVKPAGFTCPVWTAP